MTGEEHYRLAEALLVSCQLARSFPDEPAEIYPALEDGVNTCANALAAAQIHATLALAAATELIANPPKQISLAHGGAYVTDRGTQ